MVIDQGTLLDRIDYNVETMANEMETAVKELTTATKYVPALVASKALLMIRCADTSGAQASGS
jgi:syntaxin 16